MFLCSFIYLPTYVKVNMNKKKKKRKGKKHKTKYFFLWGGRCCYFTLMVAYSVFSSMSVTVVVVVVGVLLWTTVEYITSSCRGSQMIINTQH